MRYWRIGLGDTCWFVKANNVEEAVDRAIKVAELAGWLYYREDARHAIECEKVEVDNDLAF